MVFQTDETYSTYIIGSEHEPWRDQMMIILGGRNDLKMEKKKKKAKDHQ